MTPQERIADLLERGAIRQAVAEASSATANEHPVWRVVEGWRAVGAGDLEGAARGLAPLVERLEGVEGARRWLGHAVLCLGTARVLAGDVESGSVQLERAQTLHDGRWFQAQCLRFLAYGLELRGAWEGARDRYLAAAARYAEAADPHGEGSARYGAAMALSQLGRREEAEAVLRRAIAILETAGESSALGSAMCALSSLVVQRDPAGALDLVDRSEVFSDAWPPARADRLLRRADALHAAGRVDDALAAASEALQVAPEGTDLVIEGRVTRARILLDAGRVGEAVADLARTTPTLGAAELGRQAMQLRAFAAAGDRAAFDGALHRLERRVPRHAVRGASDDLERAAASVEEPSRAARCLALACRFGASATPETRARLRALREQGADIPLGPLLLERPLGEGGMGEVWRARHRDTGDAVAVKVVRLTDGRAARRLRELFEAEMQAVAGLDHPHVVHVLAAGALDEAAAAMMHRPPGSPTLVMELVEGGGLDRQLTGWTWDGLRALLASLLDALAHAHARRVVHLDLKPANVLLHRTDRGASPRLTDFGLSGILQRGDVRGVLGTPAYMAPEQARGHWRDVGPWTDLYALGCMGWQLATGRLPFEDPDPTRILELQVGASLPPFEPVIPVPDGFEGWLRTLLAKVPAARFQRAADALAVLDGLGPPCARPNRDRAPDPAPAPTFDLDLQTTRVLPIAAADAPAEQKATPDPAPFVSDWRTPHDGRIPPFLPGAGAGLFAWRIGRIVGREEERRTLWEALGEVHATREGRLVRIVGRAGLGRTRLAQWLLERAHATGAAEVHSVSPEADAGEAVAAVLAKRDDRPAVIVVEEVGPQGEVRPLVDALLDLPCLVVLTAREDGWLPDLGRRLELQPLGDAEIRHLLDQRLPLERSLARSLARRAAGHPGFALALLEDLVRRDVLAAGAEGFAVPAASDAELPEDLQSLWTRRLDALAPPGAPVRSAWEIAALLGPHVDGRLWEVACSRAGASAPVEARVPLEEAGWATTEGEGLRFLEEAAREALVWRAERAGRARTLHAVLAEILVDHHGDAGRLGRHLLGAGQPGRALEPLRLGAVDAVNAARVAECVELLGAWDQAAAAIGMSEGDLRRVGPLVVRAHLAQHTGDRAEALLERALAIVTGRDDLLEAKVLYTLGGVHRNARRFAAAAEAYEHAIVLQGGARSEVLGLSLLGLAVTHFDSGRDGSAHAQRARAVFEEVNPPLASRCDAAVGGGLVRLGRPAEAAPLLQRALEVAQAEGWASLVAEVRVNRARLALLREEPETALEELDVARRTLLPTGSSRVADVEAVLGCVLAAEGRHEEALALTEPLRTRWAARLDASVLGRAELVRLFVYPPADCEVRLARVRPDLEEPPDVEVTRLLARF